MIMENVCIRMPYHPKGLFGTLIKNNFAKETFETPIQISHYLGEFLAERKDTDYFLFEGQKIKFIDCSVEGNGEDDHQKYKGNGHYHTHNININKNDVPICKYMISSSTLFDWGEDLHFKLFKEWYIGKNNGTL